MTRLPLPTGWAEVTIGDVVDRLQYGLTASADPSKRGPRFLRITDLEGGRVDWSTVPGCDIKDADIQRYRLISDDIVFARTGSIEKAARIVNPPEAVFASYLIRGRPVLRDLACWLGLFVSSHWYVNQARTLSAGVGRANVNAKNLAKVRLPLPPVLEQRRIVEFVDCHLTRIEAASASLKNVEATLKSYRVSVLKAAVEGRLVPTEASLARDQKRNYEPAQVLLDRILKQRRRRWEEAALAKLTAAGKTPTDDKWKARYVEPVLSMSLALPGLPAGWTWAQISIVGDVQLGRQRSPAQHRGKYMRPYLRVANVFEDRIDTTDVMTMNFMPREFETYRLKFGDILLNEGQSPHLIGRPAMYRNEVPLSCFQNTLIRFRAASGLDPRYALIVFRAQLHLRRYMRIAQITTNIAHLGAGRFAEIEFPLPPTQEQKRIADEVERLMSIANSVESAVYDQQSRLARLHQAVLTAALQGRLASQDPRDEPAAKLLARIRAERIAKDGVKNSGLRKAKRAA